ncbi:NOL1/NOP2/sun family putative RNA met [Meredithblackwellia eburnea MCA 4105]
MPASGKRANRKLARMAAAFDSDEDGAVVEKDDEEEEEDDEDDEDDETPASKPKSNSKEKGKMAVRGAVPEPIEGQTDATREELEGAPSEDDEDDEDDVQEGQLTDLRAVERRMRNSARVLGNWKELGKGVEMSRSDLVAQLVGDVCQYHGYSPYLAEKLFDLFGVDEALQFFTTSDTPRPLTLRVNTLKTRRRDLAQALINRGVNLEPLEGGWSKVGLQVFSGGGVPVGATPEYLAGHYILQSASSFLPVIALGPEPHERVLDMSAAPGGKTTYMSALMGNTGEVWANDSSRGRIKGLGGNIARLGCRNVIVTNVDGREFPKIYGGFDRVLLDAPCSGTGVISKDQSVKVNKTERDFILLSHLQKQLVLCAIDSVTPNSSTGGYVVYSTCSVTTEENEAVVSYALRKRPHVKLVETGLQFGKEGFQRFRGKEFGKNMHLTRRFYPHVHNMDGFFVAKFKIGKPDKSAKNNNSNNNTSGEPFKPIVEGDSDASDSDDEPEASAFDDAEDEELIAATKKRFLKSQGVNVKATKAAVEAKKRDGGKQEGEGRPVKKSRKD